MPVARSCLSVEEVALYVGGGSLELADIESHVDGCEPCRRAIAAAIRSDAPASDDTTPPTAVGRYVLARELGAGAMGQVFEARDPELDRTIAIKLVHAGDAEANARALREGRALARLAHPNVVAVHDVGVWRGSVFLAMELVRGTMVRAWAVGRRWREIARVFAAAARGLAAAHAAGLVHRDVKPDNLVVDGDGRIRVIDFGLATAGDAPGVLAGSPAYMAPEHKAGTATQRSDQYALAVSLYEVLDGARPARPPSLARLPRPLRPVIARALATDPAARYPDASQLARALEAAVARRTRIAIAAASLVVATGLVAGGVIATRGPSRCEELAGRAAAAWQAESSALGPRFAATPAVAVPFADVARALDTFTADWSTTYHAACQADARPQLTCLDGRLAQLRAVLALGATTPPPQLSAAVFALPPPGRCIEATIAGLPANLTPTTQTAIENIRASIAAATALDDIGRGDDAVAKMRDAAALADRLGIAAIAIEANLALAALEQSDGLVEAGAHYTAVRDQARATGDRLAELEADLGLGDVAISSGRLAEAAAGIPALERELAAVGDPIRLRWRLLGQRERLAAGTNDLATAQRLGEARLALAKTSDPDGRRVVEALTDLATISIPDPSRERALMAEARARAIRLVGSRHPLLAELDLADCVAWRTDATVGRPYCEAAHTYFAAGGAAYHQLLATTLLAESGLDAKRAIELVLQARALRPPGTITRAFVDFQLASLYRRDLRFVEAVPLARDGLATFARILPADHPALAVQRSLLGRDLTLSSQAADAIPLLREALAVQDSGKTTPRDHLDTSIRLASALYAAGHPDEGAAQLARTEELARTIDGPEGSSIASADLAAAVSFIDHDDPDGARPLLATSLAIAEREHLDMLHAEALIGMFDIAHMTGNLASARRALADARTIVMRSQDASSLFYLRGSECELAAALHAAGAAAQCRAMLALAERSFGKDHVVVAMVLAAIAEAELAAGRARDADVAIARGLAIAERNPTQARVLGNLRRLALARRSGEPAHALATQALADLTAAHADRGPLAAQFRGYLAAHPAR